VICTNPNLKEFKDAEGTEPEMAADIIDLARTFQKILDRAASKPMVQINEDAVTVGQMIEFVRRRLQIEDKPVHLKRLLQNMNSRNALVCTFLALLELVRLQAILLRQDRVFSDIIIKKHAEFDRIMSEQLAARDDWRMGLTRYLWLWFAFVLVFFSASGTKLPHYALYGLTPLFILAAMHRADLGAGRLARMAAGLLLALMPLLPWLAQRWALGATGPRTAYYAALAQDALQAAPWSFYAITGSACAIGIAALCAPRWSTWYRLATASGLLTLALETAVAPWLGDVLSGPVKRAAQFVASRPENVVQWNLNVPSFSVYRGRITESRAPREGELAITRDDRLAADAKVEVLFQEAGVMIVRALP